LKTVSDPPSLKKITCPIIFLSPANDFHGRIDDLETSVREAKAEDWRVTCSPHANHQDTPPYEVATQLWFDQHLKGNYEMPKTPELSLVLRKGKLPVVTVRVDQSKQVEFIDVFYTQHGQMDVGKIDMTNTKNRFWHHASIPIDKGKPTVHIHLPSVDKPLWVYANVRYMLDKPVSGAGYYYGEYTADSYNLSSLMKTVSVAQLKKAGSVASLKPSLQIEDFKGKWKKEWFSYKVDKWGIKTHKLYDSTWVAPDGAKLCFEVRSQMPNKLTVGIDALGTEVTLPGKNEWKAVKLSANDFKDAELKSVANWKGVKELRFDESDNLRPPRGSKAKARRLGGQWKGQDPEFRNLRWVAD
jgi:hypothetical protein